MTRERHRTRRDVLRACVATAGIGALAGCAETTGPAETTTAAPGATTSATRSTETGTPTDSSYTVSMEPVGEVEFESPPETWFPYTADYADMGVALGQADGLAAIGVRARYGAHVYEELPGVSVDAGALTQLWQDGTGKEIFYELDADLHVIDPNFVVNRLGWDRTDVTEINDTVAPFFGNTIFTRVYDWHDYRYYSMYEAFEKLAQVFDERARFDAFASYHDEVIEDVESRLPEESPDVAVLYPADVPPESFYPYLVGAGTQSKHYEDLNVGDALAEHGVEDAQVSGNTIDYETLLSIDPDAIAIRLQGEVTPEYFEENVVSHMREHGVASELTAVENDRVFYGGLTYQGPIVHLFQLERAARGLYPDSFGDEELFDRTAVANIVTGDF